LNRWILLSTIDFVSRLYSEKQFIDNPLRVLSHPIGVPHAGDIDALHRCSRREIGKKSPREFSTSGEINPVIRIWRGARLLGSDYSAAFTRQRFTWPRYGPAFRQASFRRDS
jgi:hypothetical protein